MIARDILANVTHISASDTIIVQINPTRYLDFERGDPQSCAPFLFAVPSARALRWALGRHHVAGTSSRLRLKREGRLVSIFLGSGLFRSLVLTKHGARRLAALFDIFRFAGTAKYNASLAQ